MSNYSISYSTLADIQALAEEERGREREELTTLATDLEQMGIGYYKGQEYRYVDTAYGTEVISVDDLELEREDDEEDDRFFNFPI